MVKTAIAYLRQSVGRAKDDRDGGSVSAASQLAAIQKWCDSNDVTLLSWHQDIDESGKDPERKGLDAFLVNAAAVRPHYAIFWDLKRLVRNLRLFLDVFDVLERDRVELVSYTEGTRHPAFVWKLLALMAEEELTRISVNITHGKREATKRGRHLGYPPLGYLRDADGDLVIDDDAAWIIRWLFDRALEGHTATAICRMANERSLPTPGVIRQRRDPDAKLGGTQWSRGTVESTLRRPTYTGLVQSGAKSRSRYGQSLGSVIAEGKHPPLIDRGRWEDVQRRLDGFEHDTAPHGSWHWMKERVFCSVCGAPVYYVDSARSDSDARDRYWRCRKSYAKTFGRAVSERCPSPKPRITDRILSLLVQRRILDACALIQTPEAIAARLQRNQGAAAISERESLERELAEFQASRIAINDAIEKRIGVLDDLAARDRALIAKIADAQSRLTALPEPTPFIAVEQAVDHLKAFAKLTADELTPEQWARLAVRIGLRVTVDFEHAEVQLSYREPFASALGA